MNADLLKRIQKAGWHVNSVNDGKVIASCPSAGCGLKATLREGGHIPHVDPKRTRNILDQHIESFDDIRLTLRARREELALTIREVEEVGGITVDYLAKFEKDDPSKMPNAQTLIEWAQALGYELVLRPTELTPYALRVICDTRDKTAARNKRFDHENRRRGRI